MQRSCRSVPVVFPRVVVRSHSMENSELAGISDRVTEPEKNSSSRIRFQSSGIVTPV
jgi:hypothetical protein